MSRTRNVMRRQLNKFQRIETMYNLYQQKKAEIKEKKYVDGWINVMNSMKKGNTSAPEIADDIGYHQGAVNKILRELIKGYYVRKEDKIITRAEGKRGGFVKYPHSLLPKAEEFLSKNSKRPKGGASVLIGKIIGVNRNTVVNGITIIDKADEKMKKELREGKLSMNRAYGMITNTILPRNVHRGSWWKATDKIKCPHCDRVSIKAEYTKV